MKSTVKFEHPEFGRLETVRGSAGHMGYVYRSLDGKVGLYNEEQLRMVEAKDANRQFGLVDIAYSDVRDRQPMYIFKTRDGQELHLFDYSEVLKMQRKLTE